MVGLDDDLEVACDKTKEESLETILAGTNLSQEKAVA